MLQWIVGPDLCRWKRTDEVRVHRRGKTR
jgi:hypothetical protein